MCGGSSSARCAGRDRGRWARRQGGRVCRGWVGRLWRACSPADRSTSGGLGHVVVGRDRQFLVPTHHDPSQPTAPPHDPSPRPQPTSPGPRPVLCVGADMVPSDPHLVGWRPRWWAPRNPVRQPTKWDVNPPNAHAGRRPPGRTAAPGRPPHHRLAGSSTRRHTAAPSTKLAFLDGPQSQPGHRVHQFKARHITHTSSRKPINPSTCGLAPRNLAAEPIASGGDPSNGNRAALVSRGLWSGDRLRTSRRAG